MVDSSPTSTPTAQDIGELLLLGLVWGASFLFMRVAAPEFGPVALVALRVGVAALLMAPLLHGVWRQAAARRWWRPVVLVGVFNSALPFCLFAYAALSLPAGFNAILNATAILWGAVLGWMVFGVRMGRTAALGVLLGVLGVSWMVWHKLTWQADAAADLLMAITAAVIATACYGACAHYTRRHLADAPPAVVAAGSQMAAMLVLLIPGWIAWPAQAPSTLAWSCAMGLGAPCTALAYLLYFRLIARIGAQRAMTVTMLVPAFGVLLGVLLLNEQLTPGIVFGGGFVLAGSALVMGLWRRSRVATNAGELT